MSKAIILVDNCPKSIDENIRRWDNEPMPRGLANTPIGTWDKLFLLRSILNAVTDLSEVAIHTVYCGDCRNGTDVDSLNLAVGLAKLYDEAVIVCDLCLSRTEEDMSLGYDEIKSFKFTGLRFIKDALSLLPSLKVVVYDLIWAYPQYLGKNPLFEEINTLTNGIPILKEPLLLCGGDDGFLVDRSFFGGRSVFAKTVLEKIGMVPLKPSGVEVTE